MSTLQRVSWPSGNGCWHEARPVRDRAVDWQVYVSVCRLLVLMVLLYGFMGPAAWIKLNDVLTISLCPRARSTHPFFL